MGRTGEVTNDMTSGSCLQRIMVFFVPMMFGTLFQQLYNMADTIIVGKCLGINALAADAFLIPMFFVCFRRLLSTHHIQVISDKRTKVRRVMQKI